MNDTHSEDHAYLTVRKEVVMLKFIGAFVVYSFAAFGLGVYLRRAHELRREDPVQ